MRDRKCLRFTEFDSSRRCHTLRLHGDVEIIDGSHIATIRDELNRLVDREESTFVAIDIATVKFMESGFFGMLYEYADREIRVGLVNPTKETMRMMWFSQFFQPEDEDTDCFILVIPDATSVSDPSRR